MHLRKNVTDLTLHTTKMPTEKNLFDNGVRISTEHRIHPERDYIAKFTASGKDPKLYFYPIIFDKNIPLNYMALSATLRTQLGFTLNEKQTINLIECEPTNKNNITSIQLQLEKTIPLKSNISFLQEAVLDAFKMQFEHFPLAKNQRLLLKVDPLNVIITVMDVNHGDINPAYLTLNSYIALNLSPSAQMQLQLPYQAPKIIVDFKACGIGGYKAELDQLVRKLFFSRGMKKHFLEAYGTQPSKGALIFGPPGTGKTLIARKIGELFPKSKIKIINGPELKNRFVGQSAENLRDIFKEAITEWHERKENSDVHVFIFDELDAMCPIRGTHTGGTGTEEDLVSQLLVLLDGVDSPKNILVFGTTNRKELIDPAILRAGRLDVAIEISLPDEKARYEILMIHTYQVRLHKLLDEKIDLTEWAKKTINFTGAEIENLVKNAASFAQGDNYAIDPHTQQLSMKESIHHLNQLQKISLDHWQQAFAEITPLFGIDKNIVTTPNYRFVAWCKEIEKIIQQFENTIATMRTTANLKSFQFLLTGDSGTGKTALAKYLAEQSKVSCVRIMTAEQLLGLTLPQQITLLNDIFLKAHKAEFSIIIIDELENILTTDALKIKLAALFKNLEEMPNKCMIIATTKQPNLIQQIGFNGFFNEIACIPLVTQLPIPILATLCQARGYQTTTHTFTLTEILEINDSMRGLLNEIKKFFIHHQHPILNIHGLCHSLIQRKEKVEPAENAGFHFFRTSFQKEKEIKHASAATKR